MKKSMTVTVKAKIMGIVTAMLIMILTTGCSAGSTIDATLTINSDLSGSRRMNIAISNDVFDQYFNGTIEDLNALIASSCPEAITWSYSDDGNTKQYDLEIVFSSPEEYRQKVTSILGEEPTELTIQAPDSVWASGIYVKESFTDEDLLRWMKDLVVNNGYVASENADKIFTTGTVEVVYQEETYRTNSRISVDQIDYVSIDTINILTAVNGLDNFDREIQIVIPDNAMSKRGDDIKAYLSNVVPSGASSEWEVNDQGASLFIIKAGNMNAGQLEQFNRAVFASDACVVTTVDVSEHYSPFSFEQYITEQFDLSQYLAGDYASIYCTYQTKASQKYGVYNSNDGLSFWESGWKSSDSTGYLTMNDAYFRGDTLNFSMLVQRSYNVAGVDITTSRKMFGSEWKQNISFLMENEPEEEEAEAIIAALQKRLGEPEETSAGDTSKDASFTEESADAENGATEKSEKASVSISGETTKEGYQISIKREGTLEAINESSETLFGRAETLSYAKDKEFSKVKKQEAFEERLYLGELLTNRTNDFEITYTLDLGMFTDGIYCSVDSAQINGGKISAVFHDTSVGIQYVGTRTDLIALLFWIFLAAGCVSTLLLLVKLGVFKTRPKQPKAVQPVTQTQNAAATPASPTVPEGTTAGTPAETQNMTTTTPAEAQDMTSATPAEAQDTATDTAAQDTAVTEPAVSQDAAASSQSVKIIPKFCEKCGAPRQQTDMFCEKCGTKFNF